MCGASHEQKEMYAEQNAFYKQAMEQSAQTFGESQALLAEMRSVYEPILAKGPNQMGFSDEELNALNASAIEGTAQNYSHAATALNEQLAAQGGGNIPLQTGAQIQLKEQLGESAMQEQSQEQQHILESGYAQGYNEFTQASNALAVASGQLNPAAFENAATSAGSAAADTADQIAAASNSWLNAALGAAGGAAGAYLGRKKG